MNSKVGGVRIIDHIIVWFQTRLVTIKHPPSEYASKEENENFTSDGFILSHSKYSSIKYITVPNMK